MTKIRFMMKCANGGIDLNDDYLCYYAEYDETWNLEKYDNIGNMEKQNEWGIEQFEEFLAEVEKIKPLSEIQETD